MRSVLVVEDDPTMSELIADLLVDEGYRVLQTGSGAVGLRLARQYHPEAVVLDIMLGQRSGLDILRELKRTPPTRDIRVVAISGNSSLLEHEAVRQADARFLKPFALADLLAAIGSSELGVGSRGDGTVTPNANS